MMAKRKPINVWKVCYVKIRCDGVRYKVKIKTHDTSVVYLFHNRDEVIQFLAKYIANVKVLSQKPQLRGLYYTITLIGKIHVDTLTKLKRYDYNLSLPFVKIQIAERLKSEIPI